MVVISRDRPERPVNERHCDCSSSIALLDGLGVLWILAEPCEASETTPHLVVA